MNKKLLTIAVGAALAASTAVAQADVTVYGLAHVSVDYVDIDTTVSSAKMPWNVSDNSSRFGVKAKEDLGGGWAGLAQFEIFTDNTDSTTVNANRNNFVGIEQKSVGAVLLGRMDSAVKDVGGIADLFFREQIGESRAIINYGGTDARNNESVTFDSAKFGPVDFKLQWYANDSYTDTKNGYNANVVVNVKPVTIGVSYFMNETAGGALNDNTDGYRAAVKAVFGPATVTALYQQVNNVGGTSGADRAAYGIGASFKFLGKNTVKAQYYVADSLDNAAPGTENGASLVAVGYDYNFSKTTVVYAAWAKVENDANTTGFGLGGNGHGESYTTGVLGGSVSGLSIGTRIAF